MNRVVNTKARKLRFSRIKYGNNNVVESSFHTKYSSIISSFSVFLLIIVTVFAPIYPAIGSMVEETYEEPTDRSYIDETTIIGSFYADDEKSSGILVDSSDGFISTTNLGESSRDVKDSNEILEYEIREGESFQSIATKFGISVETIYQANNMQSNYPLKVGEKIKIISVDALIHKVVSGDTVNSLASYYAADASKVLEQNGLNSNSTLKVGDYILIPGGKIPPPPVVVTPKPSTTRNSTSSSNTNRGTGSTTSQYVNSGAGTYQLVWRKPQHTFVWGNCTWFVGQYKNVNWGGNANQWLRNARAKGHPTGMTPQVGAIISFVGYGYHPTYGHVGIVVGIEGDNLIIKDMNYRALGEVTTRKISRYHPAINGYIYVD